MVKGVGEGGGFAGRELRGIPALHNVREHIEKTKGASEVVRGGKVEESAGLLLSYIKTIITTHSPKNVDDREWLCLFRLITLTVGVAEARGGTGTEERRPVGEYLTRGRREHGVCIVCVRAVTRLTPPRQTMLTTMVPFAVICSLTNDGLWPSFICLITGAAVFLSTDRTWRAVGDYRVCPPCLYPLFCARTRTGRAW